MVYKWWFSRYTNGSKTCEFCDDAYMKVIKWKENTNYKPGSYDIWGYYTYNNKPIFAHTCMETDKKTYFYYNEGE